MNQMTFLDELTASLPQGLTLPPELAQLINWCQAQNQVYSFTRRPEARFASPYPQDPMTPAHPSVAITPVDPHHARQWLGTDENTATQRLAPFIRSGGDGSAIALWQDDDGHEAFVHMGSGSGSTMAGVLTRDPVKLMTLLAMGYDEICWPENLSEPPGTIWADRGAPYDPPLAFQSWLKTTFSAEIPARAADLITWPMGEIGDKNSADPFLRWIETLQPTL